MTSAAGQKLDRRLQHVVVHPGLEVRRPVDFAGDQAMCELDGGPVISEFMALNQRTLADEDGLGAISYQWQRNGIDIGGATGSAYTLTQADVGTTIRVVTWAIAAIAIAQLAAAEVVFRIMSALAAARGTPIRASGDEGVRDWMDVGVIGYRTDQAAQPIIESALAGPLVGSPTSQMPLSGNQASPPVSKSSRNRISRRSRASTCSATVSVTPNDSRRLPAISSGLEFLGRS